MAQLYRDHAGCALLRSSRELQARLRELSREIEHNLDSKHNQLLYQCLTAPFFRAHVHPALPAFLGAGEATSYADLTLWAAVIGNDGLMRLFWARAPSNQVALCLPYTSPRLPYISPTSPLHLPCLSPTSPLYLPPRQLTRWPSRCSVRTRCAARLGEM